MTGPSTPAGFASDAFVGTAEYYARYRLPYPRTMLDDLLARARLAPRGRLLDLGCGPGRLTLALADAFAEVWAIDLEPEMIAVARSAAERRGIANVRWLVGAAEALAAPAAAFDLVTAGEAFHRLDQPRIVGAALDWLRPGGCLVVLGGEGALNGDAPWQRAAQAVVRRWTDRPPPNGPTSMAEIEDAEAMLRARGFTDVASYAFPLEHTWTVEALIGHLYSTSYASRAVLGERAGAFEAGLTETLLAIDAGGRIPQTVRFGYTLARRP